MKHILFLLMACCLLGTVGKTQQSQSAYAAKGPAKIGNMSTTAFMQLNERGARMVKAIKPTAAKLTAMDQALFNKVAMGGMRQLAISQAVVGKATNEQVRMLAQSEVEEQTTIAAKLREVADAKGVTLPTEADPAVTALVNKINSASGAAVDAMYLAEGGIWGHQLLQATMQQVSSTAKDPTMKALAKATLPVIKTHLKVSREEQMTIK